MPSDSDGTSGMSRSPTCEASRSTGREPTRCCSALAARLFDSSSAARSVSASGVSPSALRGAHSSGPCGAMVISPSMSDTGEYPFSSAAAKRSGLNADPGLTAAAARAVELRVREVAPADQRQQVAGARIDRDERRLQLGVVEPGQAAPHRLLGHLLQLRNERRADVPVGRMVAAELFAELLAQVLLRIAGPRVARARIRPDADARAERLPLLSLA